MPIIFGSEHFPMGELFGFMWFLLLFIAGITSSVAMGQPVVAFLEDEFGMDRKKAVTVLAIAVLIAVQFVVFFLKYGFLDEMDYWAGTFGLVVFALIETILFMWVFGADKAWEEMNKGGDIQIPFIFYYIMKYITPLILMILMTWWFIQSAIPTLFLHNVAPENVPYIWGARMLMVAIALVLIYMVKKGWENNHSEVEK
jgi:SNF family Na+-dependent transporter